MMPPPPARPWLAPPEPPPAARAMAHALGLPPWLAQVLCQRGLTAPEAARRFLRPELAQLPDYQGLAGLEAALALLVPVIRGGGTVGVAGDYDADGVTATALLAEFLEACGARVVFEIPHRLTEGYGFSPDCARRLKAAGAQVVVTVDCGVSDFAGVAEAHALGLPVVVTDHHQLPPGELVPARAVLNPQQKCCALPGELAGAGVAFYLAAGLRAALRAAGHFRAIPAPNLRQSLDLVALGTMADVSPLAGINRILVSEGLKVMGRLARPGLRELARLARQSGPLDDRAISFALAPRINAAGRLGSARPAVELLLTRDPARAAELAQALDQANQSRRELERRIFGEAQAMLAADPDRARAGCVVLASPAWHRGVLGIVASRLLERCGRPVMLFALENGLAVGSGRSPEGFHLQKALAASAGLLTAYGGHALAAAARLPTRNLPLLAEALARAAAQRPLPGGPAPLALEARVNLAELGQALPWVANLAPHGQGNPEPRLLLPAARLERAWELNGGHLKFAFTQGGQAAEAVAFGRQGPPPPAGQLLDLALYPRVSHFRGRRLELILEDWRPAA